MRPAEALPPGAVVLSLDGTQQRDLRLAGLLWVAGAFTAGALVGRYVLR